MYDSKKITGGSGNIMREEWIFSVTCCHMIHVVIGS